MKHIAFAASVTAALLLCAAPALAQDCMIQPQGTLALTTTPDGTLAVPARLGGKEYAMAVELGTPDSAVGETVVRELGLPLESMHIGLTYRGTMVSRQVTVPSVRLGAQVGTALPFLAVTDGSLPPGTAGVLGSRLLANADVELDFRAGKLNLFSPIHCPGAVVYWADSAASVPFTLDELGHIAFHMTLDGQDVSVSFGRGAATTIRMQTAYRLLGSDAYRRLAKPHPFRTLDVGGLAIGNPAIHVVDDGNDPACSGSFQEIGCFSRTDIELGLSTLKALHLYIAFAEKTIFVTAADAHK